MLREVLVPVDAVLVHVLRTLRSATELGRRIEQHRGCDTSTVRDCDLNGGRLGRVEPQERPHAGYLTVK